jgi:hypothetical protein
VTYVAGWILMPNETVPPELNDADLIARDQKGDRS